MSKKGLENVRRGYVQQVLSGFGGVGEPKNGNGDSAKGKSAKGVSPYFWQQKSYLVLVPVIVTKTGIHGDKHEYDIRVALDVDIPIAPYKPTGKNLLGQVFSLAKEKQRDNNSIHLVYGVSKKGVGTLSPSSDTPLEELLSHTYSRTMGIVNRAVECTLQFSGQANIQKANDDTGQREEESPASQGLGTAKERGRGKEVRHTIRSEAQAENPSSVDETHGEILGNGQGNGEDKLDRMGDIPHKRK